MKPEAIAIKLAMAEMIKGVGGLEAAAGFCRVGKSTLSDAQSINKPDSFASVDVVADLEPLARDRAGWPHVTRALCQRMGGVFVAVPDAPVSGADMLGLLGRQAKESADVSQAVCAALADGTVCGRDAAMIRREVRQLIEIAVAMDVELATLEAEERS